MCEDGAFQPIPYLPTDKPRDARIEVSGIQRANLEQDRIVFVYNQTSTSLSRFTNTSLYTCIHGSFSFTWSKGNTSWGVAWIVMSTSLFR